MPNKLYSTQLPISAVASGTIPSHPHQPICPVAAAAINATPTTIDADNAV